MLSVDELRRCGLSRQAIANRARSGRLHRVYRGVYAVGHQGISPRGRFRAALKAVGGDAVLSHQAAAIVWGLLDPRDMVPELTIGDGRRCRLRGIRTYRRGLEMSEITRHHGLSVTTPMRTVLDCAAVLDGRTLRRVIREVIGAGRVRPTELAAAVATARGLPGIGKLRDILAGGLGTRSELEEVVLGLIVAEGFLRPDVNVPLFLDGHRVIPDFRWPEARVVVEADGAAWHDNPIARAEDLERQRLLERHGETVLRVTWRQAVGQPRAVLRRIRDAGAPLARSDNLSASG